MMRRLKRNAAIVHALYEAQPQRRRKILATCPSDLLLCIADCAVNILKGNCRVDRRQRRVLAQHRHTLRRIRYETPQRIRARLLRQHTGPLLSALLRPAVVALNGF